ncbi:pentatricopeptide repeat-containing protein, partial [Trifolium medium]|nr:pentatricopeptide repeat-containing protein [Trifolium medium]
MKSEGRSPNVYHYSSLLNAYSASGNVKKADALIQDMESEGLVPNKVILTTLLKCMLEELPYCVLMDGLAKARQMHEAKVVFDEMMKKHV